MTVYKSKNETKDGRKYFFRIKYKDIYGQTHDYSSQKFKKMSEAEHEEALYRIKISENKVCTSCITLKQVFEEYILDKMKIVKPQTIKRDRVLFSHLKSIEEMKINDLNLEKYKKFSIELEKENFQAHYKNKIIGLLRNLIKYSSEYHNTNDAIIKYIKNYKDNNFSQKEMDFYTYEEYLQFDSVVTDFEYHTFFEILFFMGLRQGECLALNWKDIDFNKRTISINKTLTTKLKEYKWLISTPKTKNSTRILPMCERVYNDLKTLYNKVKSYRDFKLDWFVFGSIEPFRESTVAAKKNNYCDIAKLRRIRIHDFRHSCASLLINQGASINLVSRYLGHANVSITLNTYTHLYKSELENMTKILNSL